jgi:DNA-directed RNA polymerase specialized sigma24 family protein
MPDAAPSLADNRDSERLATFHQHRSLLFSIAYRMLGSSADAEDMLRETLIRWQQSTVVACGCSASNWWHAREPWQPPSASFLLRFAFRLLP